MGAWQTGRMGTAEALGVHTGQLFTGQAYSGRLAQKHLGQPRQHLQTSREVVGIGLDDQRRVSGQRLGIDGCDEDRAGHSINRRHLAERATAQRSPQARLQQVVAHRLGLKAGQLGCWVASKLQGIVALQLDHHRLQHTLGATMNGTDHPGPRRGEMHARVVLVTEQRLAELDPIPHLHRHARLHAVIITAQQRHTAHRASGLDALLRTAGDWQIQPTFDLDH